MSSRQCNIVLVGSGGSCRADSNADATDNSNVMQASVVQCGAGPMRCRASVMQ